MSLDRQLVMPKLGLTMTEGAVSEWSIQPGARFHAGQTVFVVESDKAAVEFDAPADGVLHEILVPVGKSVPVGTEIGKWTLDGDVQEGAFPVDEPEASMVIPATPAPARIIATPLARREAAASDVDLSRVQGTGPRGRIVAADVVATCAKYATRGTVEGGVCRGHGFVRRCAPAGSRRGAGSRWERRWCRRGRSPARSTRWPAAPATPEVAVFVHRNAIERPRSLGVDHQAFARQGARSIHVIGPDLA